MADFYDDMAAFAREILAPTSRGGLGQGQVTIHRRALALPDPSAPWEQPQGYRIDEAAVAYAAVNPNENTLIDGTVINTDEMIVTTPAVDLDLVIGRGGASFTLTASDGTFTEAPVTKISKIPPIGKLVCVQFVIKGPANVQD